MISSSASGNARSVGLDTLRAAAISLVMLFHLRLQGFVPERLGAVAGVGWIGVDLFFVLSGFLIGSQLLRAYAAGQRPSAAEFYLRRAYRILPAFLLVLLLYVAVPLWREAAGPHASWQYATFTWNLLLLGYPEENAFSHVWSLCVEEHFYLLLPPVLLLLMRRPSVWKTGSALLLTVAGGVALRWFLLRHVVWPAGDEQGLAMMRYVYYPTYSRLDGLTVGVALAAVRVFRPAWWRRIDGHGDILCAAALALVLAGLWMCGFDYPTPELPASLVFAFPVLALGFGLLVASALCGGSVLGRRVPGAATLSTLAYSLYLTHKSVAHATHELLPGLTAQGQWWSLLVYGVACAAVASLLYVVVERPFLQLRVRRAARGVDGEARLDPAI